MRSRRGRCTRVASTSIRTASSWRRRARSPPTGRRSCSSARSTAPALLERRRAKIGARVLIGARAFVVRVQRKPDPRGGSPHAVPADHLRGRELLADDAAGAAGRGHGRLPAVRHRRRRAHPGRQRPAADGDGDDRARPRRRAPGDRWPVRRDQGAAGRLLPARVQGSRRGHRVGVQDPRREERLDRGPPDHGVPRGRDAGRRGRGVRERLSPEAVFRRESGRAVAALIRVLGDFELAEDAVQEAFVVALERWPASGLPENPGAWITTVARNRALDRLRRERVLAGKRAELERGLLELGEPVSGQIPDDRLKLIFTCCHPALAPEARVALTLRTLGGLTVAEIARAFLVGEEAMARRLVRARRKIRDAGIAYEVPPPERMAERLSSVLSVLYLIFNEGYSAIERRDLADEAIRLAGVLAALLPEQGEALGLRALMVLHDSRRDARVDAQGELVLLVDQDRSRWDRAQIAEGVALLDRALALGPPGPVTLQAAIAAQHVREDGPQWLVVVALYDALVAIDPSPVVALNRAVALAMAFGAQRGLAEMDALAGPLDGYHLLHSARADLLRRLGRRDEAAAAYRRALELATLPAERRVPPGRPGGASPRGGGGGTRTTGGG